MNTSADSRSNSSNQFAIVQTFANPSPERSDSFSDAFGSEVAIEGNKVLVGARFDNTSGKDSGAAYLFDANNGNLDLTFSYPGLSERDVFGTQLALDGDRALIAADGDEDNGSFGTVFLFDTNNGDILQTFISPDSGAVVFGSAVAIDENNVLIGDVQNNSLAEVGGAAFLFEADSGNSIQSFFPADPNTEDFFGGTVTIEGDNLAISGKADNADRRSDAVFLYDTTSGDLVQTLFSPNPDFESFFGSAIAIDEGRILIGAIGDDTFAEDSGAAYLFDTESGDLLQTFSLSDPVGGEFLGTDVDIQGNKVLIGARGDDTFGENSGAAYLFDVESGNLVQSLYASTPEAGDDFGFSVGIDENSLVVGAPGASEEGNEGGIVYLFETADLESSNTISGTENSDRLIGTKDSENLLGFAGDDTIFGRGGDDLLDGGAGHDRLIGANGVDQYVLRLNDGNDTIIGYQDGTDSFLLVDGLTFEDLTIALDKGRTTIGVTSTSENLATLFGVDANNLSAEDFATVSVTDSHFAIA